MKVHHEHHPLAGKTVVLNKRADDPARGMVVAGSEFDVEDYWDLMTDDSWTASKGNPAAIQYAIRSGLTGLPVDDEVVYGHIGPYGHLVHVSELGEEVTR